MSIGREVVTMEPLETVLQYIKHLNNLEYNEAAKYLESSVWVVGPIGEAFHDSKEFVEMLGKYRSRYDLKKTFSDGGDVCLLYDFVFDKVRVYASSWYKVKNGKITSVTTVFDPGQMPKGP